MAIGLVTTPAARPCRGRATAVSMDSMVAAAVRESGCPGTAESDKTLLVKLDLRTLGETNFRQNFGPQTQDGVVTR